MRTDSDKTIYFHVGIAKTGSTFLQNNVFPKLKGLVYHPTQKYKQSAEFIRNTNHPAYLISREFDQQFEREVVAFANQFPNAIPMVVFRRHDEYIASQYRRFVKNGFMGSFTEFFDLKKDTGYFKQDDLNFTRQIHLLQHHFSSQPIILIYKDLKENPAQFIELLAKRLNTHIDLSQVNLNKKHTSYSTQQLKTIQFVGKHLDLRKRRIFSNGILHLCSRLYLSIFRYGTLYIAKYLPATLIDDSPLIPSDELKTVRGHYEQDWKYCESRATRIRQ